MFFSEKKFFYLFRGQFRESLKKMKEAKDELDQVPFFASNDYFEGLHSTEVAYLLLIQQPRVQFLAFPRIFLFMLLRFIDGTAKNSGQRLDNVKQTNLELASSKLVLQKNI